MRKTIITISILVLIGAGVGYQFFFKDSENNFSVAKAEKGDITEQVSVTGSLVPLKRIKLEAQTEGQVEKVTVEVSDEVERGDLLIKLDQKQAEIQVEKSRNNINSIEQEIDLLNTKLENAKKNLEQVKDTTAENVDQAQTDLKSERQNLEDVKETENNELKHAYQDARSTLDSNYLTGNKALIELDNIKDDYFNSYDQISLKVKDKLERAETELRQAETLINQANSSQDRETTKKALNKLKQALKQAKEALRYTRDEACEDPYYESQITSSVKTTLDTQKDNVETAISNVTSAQQDVESQELSTNKNINSAQSQLNSAEATLRQAKAEREQKITQAESKIEELKQELKVKKSKLESAKSDLAQARENLKDTTITAPAKGTVTKVNIEEGETASPGAVVISMIPEKDYKIEANVSEVNIGSIEEGNEVKVTFDAFPEEEYRGKVSKIDPAETVKQGVIYYQIEVLLDHYPEKLKPGFTANLDIIIGREKNVITVPYIAVKEDDQGSYVQVLKEGQIQKKRVEIGLEGDTEVEITKGLKEGEKILLSQD